MDKLRRKTGHVGRLLRTHGMRIMRKLRPRALRGKTKVADFLLVEGQILHASEMEKEKQRKKGKEIKEAQAAKERNGSLLRKGGLGRWPFRSN